jgi:uncharacterized membrane protein YqjE
VSDAAPERPATESVPAGGVMREAVGLLAAALVTRGELAALELTDARQRTVRWLAISLAAAVLVLAALLAFALLVAALFWETYRWQAIAAVALLYGIAGAAFAAAAAAELRRAPPLFSATLHELKQDCDAIRGASNGSS